jgi:GNAT superfamily N-acetyltransferase
LTKAGDKNGVQSHYVPCHVLSYYGEPWYSRGAEIRRREDRTMTILPAVRKLGEEDASAWASLRFEALERHPLAFSSMLPDHEGTLVQLFLSRIKVENEADIFGAFDGERLVGMVGVRRDPSVKERHKAMIWGMYVTASHRRSGVGGLLLRTAIQQARSWSGVEQIQLAVSELAADARRLYETNGFREWGREPRALCWEGLCPDEIHMALDLRGAP